MAEGYPDITYLEVVNEAHHDPPDGPEDGGDINALGGPGENDWDWVINAFKLAREYFPDTHLMLNEYGISDNPDTARQYLELITLLAAAGLPIQVTEMDIDGPTDQKQLEDYQSIFPLFGEHPAVERITLWGWKPCM